ncbi:MAG: PAS domain S-box protein, partial [bacterium]
MAGPRILILDAEVRRGAELAQALRQRLESEIESVDTLASARAQLDVFSPDLIISRSLLRDGALTASGIAPSEKAIPPLILLTEPGETAPALGVARRTLHLVRGSEESLENLQRAIRETLHNVTAAENRYELFFNSVNDAVSVAAIEGPDNPGRFLEINEAACRIFGYSRSELLAMRPTDLWEQATPDKIAEVIDKLQQTGEASFERIALSKDGGRLLIEARSRVIQFLGQAAVLTVSRDITDRRHTERALNSIEQRHKLLFETAGIGIGYWTADGILQSFNRVALEQLGDVNADFSGKSACEIFGQEIGNLIMDRIGQVIAEKTPLEVEDLVQMPTGVKWYHSTYTAVADPEDNILGVQIVSKDISEQTRAKEELRESAENLREAQSIGKIGNWSWDIATDNVVWSDQVYEIFKAARQVPSYEFAKSFVHPDDLGLWHNTVKRAVDERRPFSLDYRAVRSDGEVIWVHNETRCVVSDRGEFAGYRGTVQDITEHKQIEQRLRESEGNLQALIENTDDMIASRDPEGRLIVFNSAHAKILKKLHGVEARPGLRTTDYLSGPQKTHWEDVLRWAAAGESYREEFSWDFDGDLRYYELSLNPIWVAGRTIGSTEFTRDITERKRAEAAIIESQAKFHSFLHCSTQGCAIFDANLRLVECNEPCGKIVGLSRAELIGKAIQEISFGVESSGRAEAYRDVIRTGEPLQLKRVLLHSRVGEVYADLSAFKVGPGLGIVLRDITDQVVAEENLKQVHIALQAEHKALEEKNITLREVLSQIQDRERQVATQAQANIDKVVIPTLKQLERKAPPALREYVTRAQRDLKGVFSPLVSELERQYAKLSPREVSICNMIRAGLSTREIADDLGTSIETVRSQRKQIRRKLQISGRKIN